MFADTDDGTGTTTLLNLLSSINRLPKNTWTLKN